MSKNPAASSATADRRLRVLMVAPYFPFPPTSGVEMRTYQLVRQVAARHDVTLLSNAEPHQAAGIEQLSRDISVRAIMRSEQPVGAKRIDQLRTLASPTPFACRLLHSAEMQDALDSLCATEAFDLIHVESSTMSCFRFPAHLPVIIAEHNVEYELFRRLYQGEASFAHKQFYGLEYLRFRRFEQNGWRRAAGVVLTSEREEPVVHAAAPGVPTAVVPNGVDLEYFAPADGAPQPNTAVFNGTLNYRPNLDGATYLVEEIWPLVQAECPDARLSIVGKAPPEVLGLARAGVEVTGVVPDIRPHLQQAAVALIPLRMGAGTRLKVVEGMALGKAMVSTSIGCEGIDVRDGEHLLIADDAAGFAQQILKLFREPARGQDLGAAARHRAHERYSWDLAGECLQELYEAVVSNAHGPRPLASATVGG